jgi:outer membrane protein insertion porin family
VKVETDAILTILKTQKDAPFSKETLKEDIKQIHDLGYFSKIDIYRDETPSGIVLIIDVVEKPSVMEIQFNGMKEVTPEDVKDKLETKQYTIVNEAIIMKDLRLIERQYLEKGYYLAKASFELKPREGKKHEVVLVFNVEEGGVVRVGTLSFLGNRYFTDAQIVDKFMSKPLTRSSVFATPGSIYNDDFLARDVEVLSYLYKDQGFAEVNVDNPNVLIDKDREFVRVGIELEEGIQYSVGGIEITGDLLFPDQELRDAMKLKDNNLFRFSYFRQDIEMLIDKYGDKGYAFVDVNPMHKFDKEKKLVYLNYAITKGEKVYFGNMSVSGNTKTRDNVIRREFEVGDGGLYSGTGLTASKKNVERLGFFEEVQSIRNRNEEDPNQLDYSFKVKEKPTGQLQASVGYRPSATAENSLFGQGRYSEENQSGRGWKSNLTGNWNGGKNYSLELGMTDPRVNDSLWSLGFSAFWRNEVKNIAEGISVQEKRTGASATVGRKIIEQIFGSITYKITKISQDTDVFLLERFKESGIASSLIFALSRNSTNNYTEPSEGTILRASQQFTGGEILGGTQQYMMSSLSATYYYPIDFTDTYRTYFRLYGGVDFLSTWGNKPIPFYERFRLGGPMDIRGYPLASLGPEYRVVQSPGDYPKTINNGGTKQLVWQAEYFIPIIPDANIKGLLFADAGRVYSENEPLELKDLKKDAGFGFRWVTPIAPFRFEWAYPYENGQFGPAEFIFYLGF